MPQKIVEKESVGKESAGTEKINKKEGAKKRVEWKLAQSKSEHRVRVSTEQERGMEWK